MVRLAFGLTLTMLAGFPALAAAPKITSISPVIASGDQTITITGSHFGAVDPYTGDSEYIALDICYPNCKHGWQAGYSGYNDTVGLIIQSWTDKKIVIGGFTNYGGDGGAWIIQNGDKITFNLYEPGTGQTGHRSKCTVIAGAGATTCTP